jgi:hypothetical protein
VNTENVASKEADMCGSKKLIDCHCHVIDTIQSISINILVTKLCNSSVLISDVKSMF